MATIKEKIAYLKGLMEGSDFYGGDAQARNVWGRVLEILEDLADEVEMLRIGQEETEEYLEALDSDLEAIEDEIYGDDDDDDDDDDEVEFVEMECPNCKETVYFEEEFLEDDDVEISCPECGHVLVRAKDGEIVFTSEDGQGSTDGRVSEEIVGDRNP